MKPISPQIKELVIERLKAASQQLKISSGGKNYSRKEMLESVKQENKLGRKIINIQLKYLKALASGKIYG